MSSTTLPIDSLISTGQAQTAITKANTVSQQLGADAFLKLLTTQLQNQDPEHPMDDTQSVAQLAQFSALQAQTNLSDAFASFQSNFGVMQAASLIGKHASVVTTDATGNSSTLMGTISTINVQNGKPYFTMKDAGGNLLSTNGKPDQFSTSQIVSIGN